MQNKDHTAEIFTALNITPTAHPWAYKVNNDGEIWSLEKFLLWYSMDDADYYPYELLSGNLESDGLAVRLWEIMVEHQKLAIDLNSCGKHWFVCMDLKTYSHENNSLSHAVHDALVEALGIGEEKP